MKGLLIASAALAVLIGTPALAADMPLKAPSPPPAPIANWSGCYLGLNAGAMISNDHYDLSMAGGFLDPANIFSNPANNSQLNHSYTPNPGGITGGGQIGCNQQTGTWVWGVEADMDGASRLSTTNNYGPAGPFTGAPPGLLAASHTEQVTKGADWYSTVRARTRLHSDSDMADLCYRRFGGGRNQVVDKRPIWCRPVLLGQLRVYRIADRDPYRLDRGRWHGMGFRVQLEREGRVSFPRFRQPHLSLGVLRSVVLRWTSG